MVLPLYLSAQEYNKYVDSILASKFDNGPGVSALISRGFNIEYQNTLGHSNIELASIITDKSKFRIGSITKQFTAIAILKLQEEGLLSITDTIQRYLPSFPKKEHPITIEHLLTHTSGLVELTELDFFTPEFMSYYTAPDTMVNYFKDYPLKSVPGTIFEYNNSGYHLLGLIIESVSGLYYNEYLKKEILSIAEMNDTDADNAHEIIDNRVSGYENSRSGIVNSTLIDMSIPYSGGNLLSTPADLNKWYEALFTYKIIKKESLIMAHTPFTLTTGEKTNYGYGWFIGNLQGEPIISHEGGINGFLSSVWYVPSSKTLTVLLSNCSCNPTERIARKVTAAAIGLPIAEKKRLNLSSEILKKYAGTYLMDGEEWTISIEENNLYFQFPNGNGHPIYAESENHFFAEEWDSKFIFIDTGNGEIEFQFIYLDEKVIGRKN